MLWLLANLINVGKSVLGTAYAWPLDRRSRDVSCGCSSATICFGTKQIRLMPAKAKRRPLFLSFRQHKLCSRPNDLIPAEGKRSKRLDIPIAHLSQALEDLYVFLMAEKKYYSTKRFCVWLESGIWTSSLASEHFCRTFLAQIGSYWPYLPSCILRSVSYSLDWSSKDNFFFRYIY